LPDIDHALAAVPEDLGRLFLERANAGDVDGVVALYEPEAVLASASDGPAIGTAAIRRLYEQSGGATAEIARRQRDGRWLWVADQPNVIR
jgi:hypothetical protein